MVSRRSLPILYIVAVQSPVFAVLVFHVTGELTAETVVAVVKFDDNALTLVALAAPMFV